MLRNNYIHSSEQEKQQWVKEMRLKFSIRPEFQITSNIIKSNGTINQEPPKGTLLKSDPVKKWTDKERDLLIEGIAEYGIGNFRLISEKYLPEWTPNDLRIKTIRLIGRQNLQLYKDMKLSRMQIEQEFETNKAIGLQFNQWKSGTLVYDDQGHVYNAITNNKKQRIS